MPQLYTMEIPYVALPYIPMIMPPFHSQHCNRALNICLKPCEYVQCLEHHRIKWQILIHVEGRGALTL